MAKFTSYLKCVFIVLCCMFSLAQTQGVGESSGFPEYIPDQDEPDNVEEGQSQGPKQFTTVADYYSDNFGDYVLGRQADSDDLSIYFLTRIFGNVGGLSGVNPIVGKILGMFNQGVLAIISFIIGYTVVASVIGAAQDGSGAFSSRVSPWTLVRTTGGVGLMFPDPGTGYCALQAIVMKVVLSGIALANSTWDAVTVYYEEQGQNALEVKPEKIDDVGSDSIVFHSQLYKIAFNHVAYKTEDAPMPGFKAVSTFSATPGKEGSIGPVDCSGGACSVKIYFNHPTCQANATNCGIIDLQLYIPKKISKFLSSQAQAESDTKQKKAFLSTAIQNQVVSTLNSYAMTADSYIKTNPWWVNQADVTQIAGREKWDQYHQCPVKSSNEPTTLNCNLVKTGTSIQAGAAISASFDMLALKIKTESDAWKGSLRMFENYVPSTRTQPAEGWTKSARQKGWLSSGFYYQCLMGGCDTGGSGAPAEVGFIEPSNKLNVQVSFKEGDQPGKYKVKPFNNVVATILTPPSPPAPGSGVCASTSLSESFCCYLSQSAEYTTKDKVLSIMPDVYGNDYNSQDPTVVFKRMATTVIMIVQKLTGVTGYVQTDGGKSVVGVGCTVDAKGQGLVASFMKPEEPENPIIFVKTLGQFMIDQSVSLYKGIMYDLYTITESNANRLFVDSLAFNMSAAATQAMTYGSPAAPAGIAVQTGAEIATGFWNLKYNNFKTVLEMYVPIASALASTFFTLGAIMGVYLPLLPFILFLFGAVAWMMSVAEAMVAAPLVALGVTHPEGNDLLGKSEQALILLLGVFVRPVTMLLGMICAIIVSQILLKLVNVGFATTAVGVLTTAKGGDPSALGATAAGVLIVYIYIVMSVIEQSYSLIYQIPERILKWVGGPQDQTGIGQLAEQVKGETQQAAGQAAQGAGQSLQGPSIQGPTGTIGGGDQPVDTKKKDDAGSVSTSES